MYAILLKRQRRRYKMRLQFLYPLFVFIGIINRLFVSAWSVTKGAYEMRHWIAWYCLKFIFQPDFSYPVFQLGSINP